MTDEISKDTLEFSELLRQNIEKYGTEYVSNVLLQEISSNLTYRDAKSLAKSLEIAVAQNISSKDDYVPPQRFETEWGVDGMVVMIDKNISPAQAYEHIAEKYNKPLELVEELSGKRIYTQREILDELDNHVKVKTKINKLKRKRLYKKRELVKSATPNDMFNNTYDSMLIWAEIDSMKKEITSLKKAQAVTEVRIDALESNSNPTLDNKSLAKSLFSKGFTQKEIADTLGVTPRTVRNWGISLHKLPDTPVDEISEEDTVIVDILY